jgi:hypothetical protein
MAIRSTAKIPEAAQRCQRYGTQIVSACSDPRRGDVQLAAKSSLRVARARAIWRRAESASDLRPQKNRDALDSRPTERNAKSASDRELFSGRSRKHPTKDKGATRAPFSVTLRRLRQ